MHTIEKNNVKATIFNQELITLSYFCDGKYQDIPLTQSEPHTSKNSQLVAVNPGLDATIPTYTRKPIIITRTNYATLAHFLGQLQRSDIDVQDYQYRALQYASPYHVHHMPILSSSIKTQPYLNAIADHVTGNIDSTTKNYLLKSDSIASISSGNSSTKK